MEPGRIPNRLKKYRRIAGLSQKKVSRLLKHRDNSKLSRWELGKAAPSVQELFKLCRLYNCEPHELYDVIWKQVEADTTLFVTPLYPF